MYSYDPAFYTVVGNKIAEQVTCLNIFEASKLKCYDTFERRRKVNKEMPDYELVQDMLLAFT
jgi:hypothetical protein